MISTVANSLYDQLIEEGMQKGIQEGMQKGVLKGKKKEGQFQKLKTLLRLIKRFPKWSNKEYSTLVDVSAELAEKVKKALLLKKKTEIKKQLYLLFLIKWKWIKQNINY